MTWLFTPAELADDRALAESRMTSRVDIRRKTGRTTQDETTGYEVPVWDTIHTDLPARFPPERGGAGRSRTVDIGGAEVTLALREMHVPWATENLATGDYALVTAGRSTGAVWRLVEASAPADQATAYRVNVTEEDRPREWA